MYATVAAVVGGPRLFCCLERPGVLMVLRIDLPLLRLNGRGEREEGGREGGSEGGREGVSEGERGREGECVNLQVS